MKKLSDAKFTSASKSSVSKVSKSDVKSLFNSSGEEELFDKLSQALSEQPSFGQPVNNVPQRVPRFRGMWDQNKIKREFRRMRNSGMSSDEDVVNHVIDLGAAGEGKDNPVVRNYLKTLWYNSMSLEPFKEWLYKNGSEHDQHGNELEKCTECVGEGLVDRSRDLWVGDPGSGTHKTEDWTEECPRCGGMGVEPCRLCQDNPAVKGFSACSDCLQLAKDGVIPETLEDLSMSIGRKGDLSKDSAELVAKVNEEVKKMRSSGLSDIDIRQAVLSKYGDNMVNAVFHKEGDPLSASVVGDTLSNTEIEGTGKIGQMGTPPSVPAQSDTPTMDELPELPESTESDMSLGDALEQLEESAKVVVEKVQSGETILDDKEVEPIQPDTGAIPAPAPKVAQEDKTDVKEPEKSKEPEESDAPYMPSSTSRTDQALAIQRMKELQNIIRERKNKGDKPLSETPASEGGTVNVAERPWYMNMPKKPTSIVDIKAPQYEKILNQYGDDVLQLVMLRDLTKQLYDTDRPSIPDAYLREVDPEMADLGAFIGGGDVKHQDKNKKRKYTQTIRYREAIPRPILAKLEKSFGDLNVLTQEELESAFASMSKLYNADKEAMHALMNTVGGKSTSDKVTSRGVDVKKPIQQRTIPRDLSKKDIRELIGKMIKHLSPGQIKRGVDQTAKDYWRELFDWYGDEMVEDKIANIVDIAESVFKENNVEIDNSRFNKIVAFVSSDYESESDVAYNVINKLSSVDSDFGCLVNKSMLNYIANNMANTHEEFPDYVKPAVLTMAMNYSNIKDQVLSYIAQKMNTPKLDNSHEDSVDIEESKDEALKSEQSVKHDHLDIKVDNCYVRGVYTYLVLKWDKDSEAAKKSDEGLRHAIISFVKGLESQKEFKDFGFLGQVNIDDFDADAGVAEVYFRTLKPADCPPVVVVE